MNTKSNTSFKAATEIPGFYRFELRGTFGGWPNIKEKYKLFTEKTPYTKKGPTLIRIDCKATVMGP